MGVAGLVYESHVYHNSLSCILLTQLWVAPRASETSCPFSFYTMWQQSDYFCLLPFQVKNDDLVIWHASTEGRLWGWFVLRTLVILGWGMVYNHRKIFWGSLKEKNLDIFLFWFFFKKNYFSCKYWNTGFQQKPFIFLTILCSNKTASCAHCHIEYHCIS